MSKITTAEEFLDNFLNKNAIPWSPEIDKVYGCINTAMIEFAKLHVEAALKAQQSYFNKYTQLDEGYENAYPLENIK